MKQTLQLKLGQSLTLTPQLQQSIRLLQLSTVELNQEIEEFLAQNPLLEREDSDTGEVAIPLQGELPAAPEAITEPVERRDSIELGDYSLPTRTTHNGDEGDSDGFGAIAANEPSLSEHLLQQLHWMALSDRDINIASVLVAHLDEDGYLAHDLAELHALLADEMEIDRT
jgi:RNA polymerase sigma-54 factor